VNGHTSLILEPGEKKSYQMRFVFVDSYSAVREEICRSGNLGIRIIPSMVVQENMLVYVEIQSKHDARAEFLPENITIKEKNKEQNTLDIVI